MSESTRPLSVQPPEPRRPAWMPDAVWGPIVSGLLILAAGGIGLAYHQPWLFASLGPTAYTLVDTPLQPAAKFYNAFVGHLAGIGSAFFAVWVLGAWNAPPLNVDYTAVRVWASVIAVAFTVLVSLLLSASHPPAAATTLLLAQGIIKADAHGAISIIIGVVIVAGLGEISRLIRLKKRFDASSFLPSKP